MEEYQKETETLRLNEQTREDEWAEKYQALTQRYDAKLIEYETILKERNELAAAQDASSSIDREIFSQLLINYYESHFKSDFMQLLANMLVSGDTFLQYACDPKPTTPRASPSSSKNEWA